MGSVAAQALGVPRPRVALPSNDERLNVMEMNAMDFVLDPANRNTVDILQVDLYDEEARGPVLDSTAVTRAPGRRR